MTAAITSCTCHSIREGTGAITYSYAAIGVLCPYCEAAIAEAQARAEWEALTGTERIAVRWREALYRLHHCARRPGRHGEDEPPF